MHWVMFATLTLVFAGSYVAGVWFGTRRRSIATACAGICLGAILVKVLSRYFPDIEYSILSNDIYVILRPWWVFPFSLSILGMGIHQIQRQRTRKLVTGFAVLVFVLAIERLLITVTFDPSSCTGKPGEDGVCLQSTSYSCGAAAASTLLERLGVESDEREMAILCRTNSLTGTDELSVCNGLRKKLPETQYRINLVRSDWEELCRGQFPAMATMKLTFLIDHWVVVFDVEEDGVLVGDPSTGRFKMHKDIFLEHWKKVLVAVEDKKNKHIVTR